MSQSEPEQARLRSQILAKIQLCTGTGFFEIHKKRINFLTDDIEAIIEATAKEVIGPNIHHFNYCDLLNEQYKSWFNIEDIDCSCAAKEVNKSKAQQRQALSKLLGRGEEG